MSVVEETVCEVSGDSLCQFLNYSVHIKMKSFKKNKLTKMKDSMNMLRADQIELTKKISEKSKYQDRSEDNENKG